MVYYSRVPVPGVLEHAYDTTEKNSASQKKNVQLIICSMSVRYEPISIKIGRIVPE